MDHRKRSKKDRKNPRVPIKTYKWEDIRRSRRRGGYPWTHLYKQPFNEQVDPEPFKMDSLRRSKSSSTVEKSSVQISDVTENEEGEGKMDELQIVTEPDDSSARYSIGSVVIEECEISEAGSQKPENIGLESADSSDNISQYLDKDDRGPEDKELTLKNISTSDGKSEDEREKVESTNIECGEQSKRKRKISAESSYSRISLTKQAVLKKMRNAKNKIKIPKLTFSVNKIKKPVSKTGKSVSPELKKELKKQPMQSKDIKPVYIHIPLKPPQGQTDEFSYLEFEEKPLINDSQPIKGVGSFKFLAKNIKRLQESTPNTEQVTDKDSSEICKEDVISNDKDKDTLTEIGKTEEEKSAKEDLDVSNKSIENIEEKLPQNEQECFKSVLDKPNNEYNVETEGLVDEASNNLGISTAFPEVIEKKGILKKSTEAIVGSSTQTRIEKKERAKSEEPERKRKLSLESSYSRKSLSKLEILKKLKETSQKIKKTFSTNRKKKQANMETISPTKETRPEKQKAQREKEVKPVYIHIPLKLPEEEKIPEEESKTSTNSPESPVPNDVQFIILTVPSDDEILDYHSSDVPETPSETKTFFEYKVEDLKKIAKDAVNGVTPPECAKMLDTVSEESSNGNKVENDAVDDVIPSTTVQKLDLPTEEKSEDLKICDEVDETILKKHDQIDDRGKIMIDVEDGLNETLVIEHKEDLSMDQPIDSNVDTSDKHKEVHLNLENAQSIKKKVSFKRRFKTVKDISYEDIGPQVLSKSSCEHEDQHEMEEISDLVTSNPVSDEKQIHLDKDILASTKEDDDKWSKISDHEYEPVNPPPEVQTIVSSTPTYIIVDDTSNLGGRDKYPVVPSVQSDLPLDAVSRRADPLILFQKEAATNISTTSQQSADMQDTGNSISDKAKDPNKFQLAWQQTRNQFKNRLHNIKKPQITDEDKPKPRKFKFEKPKFNLPKIPDTAKINLPSLPSFHLPRRNDSKRFLKKRQQSTESNVGDSKKSTFDFSTYPRMFKKKFQSKDEQKPELDLATVPRPTQQETETNSNWRGSDIKIIPLHSEESVSDENMEKPNELFIEHQQANDDKNEYFDDDRMTSHIRYKEDIDNDDEFESQEINNDDYLSRWNRGNFNPEIDDDNRKQFLRYEVTDLDSPEDMERQTFDYNSNNSKERYSSGSSFGGQRVGGVLEEINPDEFFLRRKGISQDNIEVGMYLSSEIKEAFRSPDNALSKMEDLDFNLNDSNLSLPETQNKRKPVKKPKRKKTPHVSQERISHGESDDEDINVTPPSRPKRRSKRIRKPIHLEDIIPYQETIPLETNVPGDVSVERENFNILSYHEKDTEDTATLESERFGHENFRINGTDDVNFEYIDENQEEKPAAPPRKHKSLKSLTSENDSILEEIGSQIQTPGIDNGLNRIDPNYITSSTYPLKRPSRKKSKTSLQSITSSQSKEIPQKDDEYLSSSSQLFTSENQIPCVEEPCVQDIRDYMGYAVIDKQKIRDPPLPPPRSPSRKKRSVKSTECNFFTVPRQSRYDDAPVRPLRNYSTLGQTNKINEPVIYENKENIDIIQYIENEDEINRDLQSGDVIRKMKDRPLPAPPRPPRKSRVLQNITSKENIMAGTHSSTISGDEVCEDGEQQISKSANTIESVSNAEDTEKPTIEKHLITPDYFTHQETITHGSLLVQSLNGDKILRDSDLTYRSEERIIPVIPTESDDESSSLPDDFKKLKDPPQKLNTQVAPPVNTEIEVLKAQKLQVVDLDVDTLTVNKLLAAKIIVSEIDSHNIRTDEIKAKSTETKVYVPDTEQHSESSILDEEEVKNEQSEIFQSNNNFDEEKKTSMDITDPQLLDDLDEPQSVHSDREIYLEKMNINAINENIQHQTDSFNQDSSEYLQSEPPKPPPRSLTNNVEMHLENRSQCSSHQPSQQSGNIVYITSNAEVIQEPDVDDELPPRPPQPHLDYMPSQPPASFYALRAQKYVDNVDSNIPKIPRRKRPPRSISRSSSEDSLITPVSRRFYSRSPEPSISQLSGQLIRTCGSTAHSALKRLITDITNNLKKNAEGKLDLHVMTIILLVLIAGLILLGYGEEKTVVHVHHWEYFNPPKDL